MAQKGDVFAFVDQTELEVIDEIVSRQILTYNDEIMVVRVIFKQAGPGGVPHSHPHVQVTSVESGAFDITIDGKTARLNAGDSFYVPSGVHHGAICVAPGVLIDVFTPMRQEFVGA